MDQIVTNSQNPGICHRFLSSILPSCCPIGKALDIYSRFYDLISNNARFLAAENRLLRFWRDLVDHGIFILRRIHDSAIEVFVAQATKPVTLGSSIETVPDSSQRGNRNLRMNDQIMQLALHQDPSAEKDYQLRIIDENQAEGGDREIPQDVNCSPSSIVEEKGIEVQKERRAPKKMVSINENVEIFSTSKKNKRIMSKKWSFAIESQSEESKPLRSILKVGSKLTDVNNE
ncbi:hypothetical protein M9H77_27753 [Catharanthus roseus]|uniref:Uncharacterized protein n=1 Tax=Catharanthus roseus TaxID=4058 RepID=A0ACC0ADL2_CATRO|nr:hypothetical protein M9H77_27753 [Catharanthus roseus]